MSFVRPKGIKRAVRIGCALIAAPTVSVLLFAGAANAQFGGIGGVRASSSEWGNGIRVSDTSYLRLRVIAEAGYDSNVFFNDVAKIDSPTLIITPSFQLTNEGRDGQSPPFRYGIGAALAYREYLSEDENTKAQRAFNPSVAGSLGYTPSQTFSVALIDQFNRLEDAPYQPGLPTIERSNNVGILDFRITPGGGRLQNALRYTNELDIFHSDAASFGNRKRHEGLLSTSWKWLPKTAIYLDGAVGYIQYLETEQARARRKANSLPYRVVAGLRGLITPKTTVNLGAGYSDAIYEDDVANPSGASNIFGHLNLTFNFTQTNSLALGYEHRFEDSPFIGDYYDADQVAVQLNQQLGAF
ncbi:MAG TPA: hypothetical protein VGF45_00845, partial [Polyangia bacterium]